MNYEYYLNDVPSNNYYMFDTFFGLVLSFILIVLFFSSLLYIFKMVYNYVLFKKMGRKGWEGIIPIYNIIVKLRVLNIPMWILVCLLIPGINIVLPIIIAINTAKKFNKDTLFMIGLILLPIVFYPILAFGNGTFNPNIKGIFEEDNKFYNEVSHGYCTNCGEKLFGKYCSKCGTKSDE